MIRGFRVQDGRLLASEAHETADVVWLDLLCPTPDEERYVESLLPVGIPTREEMQEIEVSSRLYSEEGVIFMTATLPTRTDSDDLLMGPVTFVLDRERLITVRYHEPRAFEVFPSRAAKTSLGCSDSASVLIGLLETSVDRLADVLERLQRDVDTVSRGVFQDKRTSSSASDGLQEVLREIGRKGDVVSNLMDSLATLQRVAGFFNQVSLQRNMPKDHRARIKTLARDVQSLTDHASFLSEKATFLLDATLGFINIQQNATIKIFSVVAVVFLPPTLIASIYGMNFEHMPELTSPLGYPLALLVMIASAVLPYWFFKRRGWL